MNIRTQKEWINEFNIIHNSFYNYNKTDISNRDENGKIVITCPIHGEFKMTPSNHLQNKGCPMCHGNKKLTLNEFISKSKNINGEEYDYYKTEYINHSTPLILIHKKCGNEFKQTPSNHLKKNNPTKCPYCAHRSFKYSTEEWIKKANEVHSGKYQYIDFKYENKKQIVDIICPIHGPFKQVANDHLHGHGCPICRESKLEKEVRMILTNNNIEFESQKHFDWLGMQSLDFYIPSINVAIECQGKQHFKPIDFAGRGEEWAMNNHRKIKELDIKKNMLCDLHDIKIIYYSDNEYNENIITDNGTLLKEILL